MTAKPHGFAIYETVGFGIPNPRPSSVLTLSPELLDRLEAEASEAGVALDDYLEHLFEPDKEDDATP